MKARDLRGAMPIVLAAGLAGYAALAVGARERGAAPRPAVAATPLPDVRMLRARGGTVAFSDFRGRWLVVYFGYTGCPDVCPTDLADLAKERRALGPLSSRVAVLVVTLDPEDDGPGVLGRYLRRFDPDFEGAVPRPSDLPRLQAPFHVLAQRVGGTRGQIAHTTTFFLVDPHGLSRGYFSLPLPPGTLRRWITRP